MELYGHTYTINRQTKMFIYLDIYLILLSLEHEILQTALYIHIFRTFIG